jgi:Ca2+-binding EF-hand superfamily protein
LRELFLAIDKDMEEYEINYLFDCIDTDKNGEISYEEFNNWMIKN